MTIIRQLEYHIVNIAVIKFGLKAVFSQISATYNNIPIILNCVTPLLLYKRSSLSPQSIPKDYGRR